MLTIQKDRFAPFHTVVATLRASAAARRARRARLKAARIARAAFQTTLHLDDRMLADMGVTRAEVEWAATLPIDECAATALHALRRRGRAR